MTLTQAAALVKHSITISVIVLVLGILSFVGYRIWYAYYLANLPKVEEKPDTRFGQLPPPDFPTGNVSTSNFSYSLDTTTGGLPRIGVDPGFEKLVKVYFVTQTVATLLAPDRSQALAQKFEIKSPPEILTETKYRFSDGEKSLLVNLDNGNFSYTKIATISAKLTPQSDDQRIAGFKNILSNLGVMKNDLSDGRAKVILLKLSGENLATTELQSEADAVQISLWPASIDKKPIYTANFNKALINGVALKDAGQLINYISLDFIYYPIDTSTSATYPMKTAEQAFEDLKNGRGVVVLEPDKPQVSITSVNLGYFLSENYTPYLQPIFVFEGPSFAAYVSAITEQLQSSAK